MIKVLKPRFFSHTSPYVVGVWLDFQFATPPCFWASITDLLESLISISLTLIN